MDSKAIAVCLLLSVAACDDSKSLLCSHEFHQRQLPIPGLPTTPPCGACVINVSSEFLASLKIFGPMYKSAKTIATTLRTSQTTRLTDIKANIAMIMQDFKDDVRPALEKWPAGAATMGSCPALKTFFDNLNKNIMSVLTAYIQDWPSLVTGTDVASIADALRKAVIMSIPILLTMYRDMLYNAVQLTPHCSALGPIIYLVFDSQGIGEKLLLKFLNSGGSLVNSFIISVFGSFIPGNQAVAGSLDFFVAIPLVICAGLGAVVVGADLGEVTAGYCPAGSMGGNFDPVGLLKDLLCRFLIVIEPSAGDDGGVCAPGSSQGGSSPVSQGLVTGLLCIVLNLLGLGGLLGCPGSGGSNPVQAVIGLICELQNAMSGLGIDIVGLSLPFCPLG